jgi:hypothetical protein
VGRRALCALPAGTMLSWEMLDESDGARVDLPVSHAA